MEEYFNDLKNESPDLRRKKYVRIFNNSSFEEGGRFYGPWWQQIKSRKIKLRNKLMCFIDFRVAKGCFSLFQLWAEGVERGVQGMPQASKMMPKDLQNDAHNIQNMSTK